MMHHYVHIPEHKKGTLFPFEGMTDHFDGHPDHQNLVT